MSTLSRRVTALFVGVCVALTACSQQPPGGPSPASTPSMVTTWTGSPEDKSATWATDLDPNSTYGLHLRKGLGPILKPETRVLGASETGRITSLTITNSESCLVDAETHPMCEFAITFTSLPEGLAVGAVLNAGITQQTPSGLLVKVTAIDANRITAVQATLQDALVQGEFWVERAFGPDQLRGTPKLAPGVTIAPREASGLRRPLPGAIPAFDQLSLPGKLEIDTSPVSGVHLGGTLDFGAGCGLDGGVGGSDIAWMEISCKAWESASLSVESSRSTPVSKKDIFLADFPLAGIVIPIGPVIVVVIVDILVTADLSGQVHVGMKYHGYEHAEVYGGLKFSIGHGLDHDGGVTTSASGTSGVPKADLAVTALGRAELRISAYGVLGIGVGGDASLTLSGGPSQNPRWRITANAGLFVEMFLGILGFKLSAWIRYHLKQDFEVSSGGYGSPTLTVTWPADGQVIQAGGLMTPKVDAKAVDPEDGSLPVRWTDKTDNVTVQGTGPQSLPFTKLGPHVLTVSATDSDGATVEKTITVTVQAPALTLTLHLLRLDGSGFTGPASGASGSTLLVDAVVTSGLLNPPQCSALAWSASNASVQGDGSCRVKVTLGQPGTAAVTATLADTYGTSVSGSVTTHVSAAPATTTPQFLGIDAVAGGRHLSQGDQLLGAEPVQLTVSYLNHDQAAVTPTYHWTCAAAGTSPVVMPGGRELLVSTRKYTPPSPWGHTATFTVVIRNAATKAVLETRTFTVTWQSQPK
ncbi:MAG TPA: hypothetical protein VGK53_05275 [Propionicimonas sp.]